MVLAFGRSDQFAKLVVEPLIAEIAFFLRNPLLKPKMRFDDELGHWSPPYSSAACAVKLALVIDASVASGGDPGHVTNGMMDMNKEAYSELSLRELRVLHALLQQRSITRTAGVMEMTQPSISKMLRRLRAQFSDPLFVRNGQAMQPTAKALDITDRLRVLLAAADGLRSSATEFDP